MAKHMYKIASETGAEFYQKELGETVELDLSVDEARAVVAAGWVEPDEKAEKEAKK
jgi:hypothetical protein